MQRPDTELPAFRHLPIALKRLLCNPVWLLVSLLTVTEQNIATGFITFISKYLQVSFDQPAARASIITGAIIIPAAVSGILSGAFVLRRWALRPLRGALRLLVALGLVTTLLTIPMVLFNCAETAPPSVGLLKMQHFSFSGNPATEQEAAAKRYAILAELCWRSCQCPTGLHEPVCAAGTTFVSACHAGCSSTFNTNATNKTFAKCACAGLPNMTAAAAAPATAGKCPRSGSCPAFIYFLLVLFLLVFLTAVGQEPAHIITLSAVPRQEISFALGMQVSDFIFNSTTGGERERE